MRKMIRSLPSPDTPRELRGWQAVFWGVFVSVFHRCSRCRKKLKQVNPLRCKALAGIVADYHFYMRNFRITYIVHISYRKIPLRKKVKQWYRCRSHPACPHPPAYFRAGRRPAASARPSPAGARKRATRTGV